MLGPPVSEALASNFTLIVPTYNRSEQLERLLTYLRRHRVEFKILVLDSSEPAQQQANRDHITSLDLNVQLEGFDSSTRPWDKFLKGSELVQTAYCSLCADDD